MNWISAKNSDAVKYGEALNNRTDEILEGQWFQDPYSNDGISKTNYFRPMLELWQKLNKVTAGEVINFEEFDKLRMQLGYFRSQLGGRINISHQHINLADVYYVIRAVGQIDPSLNIKLLKTDTVTAEKIIELLTKWSKLPRPDKEKENVENQPGYYPGLEQFQELFENFDFGLSSTGDQKVENTTNENQFVMGLVEALLTGIKRVENDDERIITAIKSVLSQFKKTNNVAITPKVRANGRARTLTALFSQIASEAKKGDSASLSKYISDIIDIVSIPDNSTTSEVSIASAETKERYVTELYRMLRYPKKALLAKKVALEKIVDSITSGIIDSEETILETRISLLTSLIEALKDDYNEIQVDLEKVKSNQEVDLAQLKVDITNYNQSRSRLIIRLEALKTKCNPNSEQREQVEEVRARLNEAIVQRDLRSTEIKIGEIQTRINEVKKSLEGLLPNNYNKNTGIYSTVGVNIQTLKNRIQESGLDSIDDLLTQVKKLEDRYNLKYSELMKYLFEKCRLERLAEIREKVLRTTTNTNLTYLQKVAGLNTTLMRLIKAKVDFDATQQNNATLIRPIDITNKSKTKNFALTMGDLNQCIEEVRNALNKLQSVN